MKKLIPFFPLFIAACACVTACMDDSDEDTKVECQYGGTLAGLSEFEDLEDSLAFSTLIGEAFEDLGAVGSNSIFTINVTVNISSEAYANYVADYRADSVYTVVLNQLTLDKVKSSIFSTHSDSLSALGYASASDLPLEGFTATFELYSARDTDPVETYEKTF